MKKNNHIIQKILIPLVIFSLLFGSLIFGSKRAIDEKVNRIQNVVEITEDMGNNKSTTDIPELTEQDEKSLEEQEVESEGFELQGEIAYESGESFETDGTTGSYSGLTYYSQIDGRWASIPYTSTGNYSQTIGTSGCAPTSSAMIVSSIKGTVTPDEIAADYVSHGYRSANNGTYWSAMRYTADKYNIGYTESSSLDRAVDLIRNQNYMATVSVGNGLFTTGGHFMVVYGVEGDNLKIYDPYLYSGKFETSTRRGKVTVVGNTVYCPIENFRNYANYQNFFLFANEHTGNNENPTTVVTSAYTRYVTANSGLKVRTSPNGSVTRVLPKNTQVKVYENSGEWSRIDEGWVYSYYLSAYPSNYTSTITVSSSYNVITTANSGLIIRAGAGTNYRKVGSYAKGTTVTIVATQNGWGKNIHGNWIYLGYTTAKTTSTSTYTSSYKLGRYKVSTSGSVVNVRSGAGTNYSIKRTYKNHTVFDTYQISGSWAKTPSGWVYLPNCKLMYRY